MSRSSGAAIAVLSLAAGVILWRESHRPPPSPPQPAPSGVQVVLYADLSEVDEAEGCGAIIRGVRAAAKRGASTLEVDARNPSEQVARYRLMLAPTVLFLDHSGREVARFEGEGPETVRGVLARLGSP